MPVQANSQWETEQRAGNPLVAGAAAGFAATVPMTAVMLAGHRLLPPSERYALPPAEITEQLLPDEATDEQTLTLATLAAHFGYGAAVGALYRVAVPPARNQAAGAAQGAVWGTAVWAGSYLGWLPAAHILKPATEHPARRNALMIGAHLVWGAALGSLLAGGSPRSRT